MKLRLPNKLIAAILAAAAPVLYTTLSTATLTAGAALVLSSPAKATETGKTLHIYILTGQSNSLGAIKGDPASAETLDYYSTVKKDDADGILMWDGNITGSLSSMASNALAWYDTNKDWMTVQPQQTPTGVNCSGPTGTPYESMTGFGDLRAAWGNQGNGVMGPEYGFAYMMQRKGWKVNSSDDIAIIKVSRDGGNNSNWIKPDSGTNCYTLLRDSIITALKNVDTDTYSSIKLDGLMYLQGETGNATNAANAKSVMEGLISNLKSDIAAAMESDEALAAKADKITVQLDDLVLGEPATWGTNDPNSCPTLTGKNFLAWANESDNVGFVHTRDLTKIAAGDSHNVHYDGNSQITIGARYAYTMAATQCLDTTEDGTVRVRSQQFGDTDMDASLAPVSLNDDAAWWQSSGDKVAYSAESMANTVAVWDVSSANMGATTQGTETLSGDLTVGGIRIEDPYADDDTTGTHNATITIKNATDADATLTVGNQGIELQRGNLKLQTKVATNAAQTWKVAGGKTLTLTNSIGGEHTVTLHKHDDAALSAGVAQFDFSAATDEGHRTWMLGDGVKVALSATGFAQSNVELESAAAATLTGGAVSLNSLTLGNGATLLMESGLTLSTSSLTFGDSATLNFGYGNNGFANLNATTITAGDSAAVSVALTYDALMGGTYTLGSGWSGWNTTGDTGKHLSIAGSPDGFSLSVTDAGDLVLTAPITAHPVDIPAGTVMSASSITASAADPAVLTGAGTLNLGEVRSASQIALPQNVSLAPTQDWTGTVLLTSAGGGDTGYGVSNMTADAFNSLVNGQSWVELQNLRGYFTTAHHDITANLRLTGEDALVIAAGSSSGYTLTFSGKIAGNGELENRYGSNNASVTFKNDLSEWTGKFNQSSTAANGTPTLYLKDAATTINAEIAKPTTTNGLNLNLGTITNDAAGYTFNNAVTVSQLTTNGNAVILGSNTKADGTVTHGNLNVSGAATMGNLTLGAGTTATFGAVPTFAADSAISMATDSTLAMTSNGIVVDLADKLSGAGTVRVNFTSSGHDNSYVTTGEAFSGALDLSGKIHLKKLNDNTATAAVSYYLHGADIWWNDGDDTLTVAHNITLGGSVLYRAEKNATFSGILTDDGSENFNWILGSNASNQNNKTITLANSGAANINKVTLAYDNLVLQQASGDTGTTLYTGDIVVNAGRQLTLTPKTGASSAETASSVLHGGVWLNGTSTSAATVYSDAKAFVIEDGVHLGDNAYGTVQFNNWGNAYIHGLEGSNATLELLRNYNGGDRWTSFVSLQDLEADAFSGTLKLSAQKAEIQTAVIGSPTALASTVIQFNPTGPAQSTMLAFADKASDIVFSTSNQYEINVDSSTFGNGTVKGLQSVNTDNKNQYVYADGLTVNTAAENSFAGTIAVNTLVIAGTGSQELTGNNTIRNGASVGNDATLALGGTTTLGGTIANSGTLNLSGTVTVDTTRLWNYEVKAAEGESTNYSDGANGFLTDATLYLVKSNDGSRLTLADTTTISGVEAATADNSITFQTSDRTTYYVNGDLGYNANMNEATNLHIAQGATLTATSSANPTGDKTLMGSGTYKATTGTNICRITATDESWTGIVELRRFNLWNGASNLSTVNLNTLGNANSKIRLAGVWGIDNNWHGSGTDTITTNLILEDVPDPGQGNMEYAWWIQNGNSDGAAHTYEFAGAIEGSGRILKQGTHRHDFIFSGDVSKWTGSLTINSSNNNPNITFKGNATEINAAVLHNDSTKTSTLILGAPSNGATEYQLNNTIKVNALTATGQNVVFGRTPVLGTDGAKPTFTVTGNVTANHLTLSKNMNASVGSITATQATTVEQGATLTLTTNLTTNNTIKAAMTDKFAGAGTLVFSTGLTGDNFNDNTQFNAGHNDYTMSIDNVVINSNLGFNNYGGANSGEGLLIESGKSLTVNGKLRVETQFDLRVAGTLTANELVLGHNASGTAFVHILTGADVKLGGMGINNGTNGKTFTMEGGTLTFTKDGKVFSDANATNTTASFAFTGGTLKAAENSWDFNHAATIGSVTLDAAAEKTLTLSGALTKAANGDIVKTGAGTVVLDNTADLGKVTLSGGEMRVNNTASFTEIVATSGTTTSLTGTGAVTLTTTAHARNNPHGLVVNGGATVNVTASSVSLANGALYNNGTLNIGGGTHETVVKAKRLINGNIDNTDYRTSTLNIANNATVAISGSDNSDSHITGVIFSEWHNNTTINISGKLLAQNATVKGGDWGSFLNIEKGGVLATLGLTGNAAATDSTVNLKDGGTLILGGSTSTNNGTTTAQAGSTIGIYANTVTFARDLTLTAADGKAVTIDTEKYAFNSDGTAIDKPAGEQTGGSLTMSGVLSGAGALVKTGKGTLTLSGANTYTGGTEVQAGKLVVENGSSSTLANSMSIARLAELNLAMRGAKATFNITGDVSGAGDVTISAPNAERVYNFTGDLSGLTGNLRQLAGSGSMTLNITNTPVLNANIYNEAATNCYMNVNVGQDMVFNGDILKKGAGKLNIAAAAQATLHGAVTADTLTINAGKSATFNAAAGKAQTIATLSGSGALKVVGTAATETQGAMGGLLHITGAHSNYTGTVTLSNVLEANTVGIVAENTGALSGSVVNFESGAFGFGTTNTSSLLAFRNAEGVAIDGTVAGLNGNRGKVVADTLTINVNVADSPSRDPYAFQNRYDTIGSPDSTNDAAVLEVNKLVKTGVGTQIIGGEYTEALGFAEGLVIANGIEVEQGTLHMKTRGTVKADISVAAGATFKTSDNEHMADTAEAAMHYNGKLTLNGSETDAATLFYTDGSTYIANGLEVNGYGKVVLNMDTTQFIGGLYSEGETPSELTLERYAKSQEHQNTNPRYIVVDKTGEFNGTIKMNNNAVNNAFGIVAAGTDAQNALAGAVIDFTDSTNNAIVAFVEDASMKDPETGAFINSFTTYEEKHLTAENLLSGTVAGLSGTNGAVYAETLTINAADGTNHEFGGALNVTNIVKDGTGTQKVASDMSAFNGDIHVQQGTLDVDTDTISRANHVEVAKDAMLKLKAGASLTVNELVLGNTTGTAPAAEAGPSTRDLPAPVVMSDVSDGDVNAKITVTGTQEEHGQLTVGIGGTDVRGINLTVSGTVDYSAIPGNILNLNGGSLTLSTLAQPSIINLSDSLLTPLESHQMVEVMSGIGALTVNDFSLNADAISGMNAGELVVVGSASSVFGNNFGNQNAQVLFRADGDTGTLLVTPEPTTTALSLLALAALAARRKRK